MSVDLVAKTNLGLGPHSPIQRCQSAREVKSKPMIQPIEIYPMAMFPTLSVADVRASVEPYTERVGFASVFTLPGPDGGVAMGAPYGGGSSRTFAGAGRRDVGRWSMQGRGGCAFVSGGLGAGGRGGRKPCRQGSGDCGGPVTRPWNVRDIVVFDPDGYRLVFFAPVDISRSFEDVMGDVSEGGEVSRHD